jgi:hypothetical protein
LTTPEVWWPEPQAGLLAWCRFPDTSALQPGPKPRPALILTVFDDEAPRFRVLAVYGTTQKVNRLYAAEFAITPADGAAFRLSGLSYPTKFNLAKAVELPYSTPWFDVPPAAPFGQSPQLGVLHPNLMRRTAAAWRAAQATTKR